jgi:UDP-glucose 4-epimerase
LRYFNAAGADPDGETGEDHEPETHLIPLVLDVAAGARDNITVLGNDYPTPDGTCIRDYIHVSDIAEAHVLAFKAICGTDLCKAYNLGTGAGISVSQVIETARKVTGRDIRVVQGARRPGDPAILLADSSRAAKDLGWRPRLSDLDEIIATAWAWRQRNAKNTASTCAG